MTSKGFQGIVTETRKSVKTNVAELTSAVSSYITPSSASNISNNAVKRYAFSFTLKRFLAFALYINTTAPPKIRINPATNSAAENSWGYRIDHKRIERKYMENVREQKRPTRFFIKRMLSDIYSSIYLSGTFFIFDRLNM
jgi:hypothetical protein